MCVGGHKPHTDKLKKKNYSAQVPSLVSSFARMKRKEDHPGIKEELRKELSKLEEVPLS